MGRPRKAPATLASDLLIALTVALARVAPPDDDGTSWPSARWQTDPVGFATHHFGVELTDYQIEILEGVRDNRRVAVASGRKIGKSLLAAILALWFFSSFPDARVFITASVAKQVTKIIWREIRKLHQIARDRGHPLSGTPAIQAATGLVAPDGREIIGFANASREDAAGISGANLLYIFDEATGIEDAIFEAADGNQAGAGGLHRMFMISNPTRCEGEFYRAFHEHKKKAGLYWIRQVSSLQSPNIRFPERLIVPGLAGREWLDDMRLKYGDTSPWWMIHVEGKFVEGEEGRILTLHDLVKAQARWDDAVGIGPLVIGLDPAGAGVGGDESVFACRRGDKVLEIAAETELTAAELLVRFKGLREKHAPDSREMITVVIDRAGSVGAEVYGTFRAAANEPTARFRVVGIMSSDNARRQPNVYKSIRDELWAGVGTWIKEEKGAIPEHHKLVRDLHAPCWEGTNRNLMIVTAKSELKKVLGRSPDYGDALCLACWVRGDEAPDQLGKKRAEARETRAVGVADPYAGAIADPYGDEGQDWKLAA